MMHLDEAILNRASVKVFSDEAVPRDIVQRCLDMAIWAPNHHLTEPWHFIVIMGEARERLAQAVFQQTQTNTRGLEWAKAEAKALKERKKIFSAPVIIAVYADSDGDAKVSRENYAATAAAMQNLLLTAHSLGYGAIWRTSDIYDDYAVRELLDVPQTAVPTGAVFLGRSGQRAVRRRRTPASEKTYWLDEKNAAFMASDQIFGKS